MAHGHGDTALRGSVELGHDDAVQIERLVELASLLQAVLTRRGIDHQHGLDIDVGALARDVDHLLQLAHELVGGVQTPRGVDEDQIASQLLGAFDDVIAHACRVTSAFALHDLDATALAPDVKLLDGGGTEGVGRSDEHLATAERCLVGELTDRRGLSRAVNAHEEHADGIHAEGVGIGLGKQSAYLVGEKIEHRIRIGQSTARGLVTQTVDDLHGRLGTQVAQDERLLQVIPEILVELGTAAKQHVHPLVELRPAPIDLVLERHVNPPRERY